MKKKIFFIFIILLNTYLNAQSNLDTTLCCENRINQLFFDTDTSIYIATYKGLFFKQGKLNMKQIVDTCAIFSFIPYNKQKLFFSRNTMNLLDSNSVIRIIDSFANNHYPTYIKKVSKNNKHEVFVATSSDYIYKVTIKNNYHFDTLSYFLGKQNKIYDILIDNDNNTIWAATSNGAYFFDKGMNKFIKMNEIGNFPIKSIAQLEDTVYFGSYNKIIEYNLSNQNVKSKKLCINADIEGMLFDKDKRLWFLTEDKIGIFFNENKQLFSKIKSSTNIVSNQTTCFYFNKSKNVVYVGTASKGIFTFSLSDIDQIVNCKLRENDCGKEFNGKDRVDKEQLHYIGVNQQFEITWDMKANSDRMKIYDSDDMGNKFKLIYDSKDRKGEGVSNRLKSTTGYIKIDMSKGSDKSAYWTYKIKCID